jgi:ACS family hexuronate transporter-like MFS transporter
MSSPNPYESPRAASSTVAAGRSDTWRWYVCIVLLLGTVVNYMDRLTINTLALPIQQDFGINNEYYGNLELGFGLAFAFGSIFWGCLVDWIGVYWIYPIVLVGWSAMGFFTGLSHTYTELLVLRILLGFFEAGHWPCGLKTVQLLMAPRDRALGNSLLQSGTAIGAVLAPIAIIALATEAKGGWRLPFLVIGAGGCAWVLMWLSSVRPRDLRVTPPAAAAVADCPEPGETGSSLLEVIFSKRYLGLVVMVICINLNWHLFRVWMPKFLQETRDYSQNDMLKFSMMYYLAADVGVMSAGAASQWMSRRGFSVYSSRMWAFFGCACMTLLTSVAVFLPTGGLLTTVLLVVAFGNLGCFATYYSLAQDLSRRHQGKISGTLGTCTWLVTAAFHPIFGRYLDRTHNYDVVFGAMGWLPMLSLLAVLFFWRSRPAEVPDVAPELPPQPAEALGR